MFLNHVQKMPKLCPKHARKMPRSCPKDADLGRYRRLTPPANNGSMVGSPLPSRIRPRSTRSVPPSSPRPRVKIDGVLEELSSSCEAPGGVYHIALLRGGHGVCYHRSEDLIVAAAESQGASLRMRKLEASLAVKGLRLGRAHQETIVEGDGHAATLQHVAQG